MRLRSWQTSWMIGPSGLCMGKCPELTPLPLAAWAGAELAVEASPILLGQTRGVAWVGPELAVEVSTMGT
eukprot:12773724-Alexandrium_andersonii.AAC.1